MEIGSATVTALSTAGYRPGRAWSSAVALITKATSPSKDGPTHFWCGSPSSTSACSSTSRQRPTSRPARSRASSSRASSARFATARVEATGIRSHPRSGRARGRAAPDMTARRRGPDAREALGRTSSKSLGRKIASQGGGDDDGDQTPSRPVAGAHECVAPSPDYGATRVASTDQPPRARSKERKACG
jgi:hypothetical protein